MNLRDDFVKTLDNSVNIAVMSRPLLPVFAVRTYLILLSETLVINVKALCTIGGIPITQTK